MTGQDIQAVLDDMVAELNDGNHVGGNLNAALRDSDGVIQSKVITEGNAASVAAVQALIDPLKVAADAYEIERSPVQTALESFKTAQAAHQTLIDSAKASRDALGAALEADAGYQTAKTALDAARADADYVTATAAYKNLNVSENYGNLRDAKGKFQTGEF